jgi:hypothetical protein
MRLGHRWFTLLRAITAVGGLATFSAAAASSHVVATWDDTDNPWQSAHWAFLFDPGDFVTDVYPDNRPDETFNAWVNGGTATLMAPVTLDGFVFPGGDHPPGTVAGPFNITVNGINWGNGILRGSGRLEIQSSLSLFEPQRKVIDGWTVQLGNPSSSGTAFGGHSGTGPLQLDNGAVFDNWGSFSFSNNVAVDGSGGVFNNHEQLFANTGLRLARLEFGPNVAFHNFGTMEPGGTLQFNGGGSSLGTWRPGAERVIFNGGTRQFTLGGPERIDVYNLELRSGLLELIQDVAATSFVMNDGLIHGNGNLRIASPIGDEFFWQGGAMNGEAVTALFAMTGTIGGPATKSLGARRLWIGDFSEISYTSDSDFLMRDGAAIEIVHDDDLMVPDALGGRFIIGPVRGPSLGAFRHVGGETPAINNAGLVNVLSPIDFIGVPFTNQDRGFLTIDALGELRTDSALDLKPGSTTILLGGAITSSLPVDNRGTVRGAGTVNGNLLNTGVLQVGSNEPAADGILFLDINGNLTLNETSSLRIPILGRTQRTQYGNIDVNGTTNFNGQLQLNLGEGDGSWIRFGDTFTLLNADGPIPGRFANIGPGEVYPFMGMRAIRVYYGPTSPYGADRLVVALIPEPGVLSLVVLAAALGCWMRTPRIRVGSAAELPVDDQLVGGPRSRNSLQLR